MLPVLFAVAVAAASPGDPGPGIPETLARERASVVSDVGYDLTFSIPARRSDPVTGRETLRFVLAAPHRIVLDFAHSKDRIRRLRVGGRDVPSAVFADEHVIVPAEATTAGVNDVEIEFVAGDEALNRSDDFMYTLFVPARAHLAFPCFDQPDLKARFRLTLSAPAGWQVVANGAEEGPATPDGTVRFAETAPLPTYLFAFAAGRFTVETAMRDGRELRMFHRETDAAKVARNRDAIFDLHAKAIAWLEDYTGIRYPFGKFDFVLIPSFQFGGMEHPGAIFYNASSLMLDESATENQFLDRASTIAHETSHMWFGDLVTMRWFDDVWMKEVFANVMAAKIVNPSFPQVNHELRFLMDNYPAAYGVDRTAGANPIRQPLENLDEAAQLYGPIIYEKAPIVMRQLEAITGADAFRDGLREYLKTFSYGNATWNDLIRILDPRTPEDLAAWSHQWVEERGRPSIATTLRVAGNRITSLSLHVTDSMGRGLVWPQRLRVTLGYPGGDVDLPVFIRGATTDVPAAAGRPAPLYVLPAGGGLGYGLFVLDDTSRVYLRDHVEDVPDALTRGAAWVTLWDNMLEHRVAATAFLDAAARALPHETDEQNIQRVLGYVESAFWRFLPSAERQARSAVLEGVLRAGLDRATTTSEKAAWFNAYRDVVLTPGGVAWLTRLWRHDETIRGLPLSETDDIRTAEELAVRDAPGWAGILQQQLERTKNPDRQARFRFVMPALSADPAVRAQAFERLRDVANRRREPWVTESLTYLNHPLRSPGSRRYVRPALEMLREIQRTGDIFFPTNWIQATLGGHRSGVVAAQVRAFLAEQKDYPQRLRWIVLTAADPLFRAADAASSPQTPRVSR
jgi:aminopeptidase N